MSGEAILGFALNDTLHVFDAHFTAAGLGDQRAAGEIMWVGGSTYMFFVFLTVGLGWAKHERRLADCTNRYGAKRASVALALKSD